jgi:signal transduction histidine kinase
MRALAFELASAPASEAPFGAICERTLVAVGAQVVGISTFDPARSELEVRFASIQGQGLFARLNEIIGARSQGLKMKVPPHLLRQMWGVDRFDDLTAISFGAFPRTVDRVFRRVLGVGWFYGVALRHQNDLLGSMLIVMPKGAPEVPRDQLELLANLGAFMVWRHRIDQALRASEARAARGAQAEAVNLLARGLAHDFGNLLTAVVGYSRLARRDSTPGSPLDERLLRIEAVAAQATELTRRLMVLSAHADGHREPVDLSALARDLAPLLESGLRTPGCRVQFKLAEGLPRVSADRCQLNQVALNLAVNACQAMDGRRGRLVISTGVGDLGRAARSRLAVGSDCEAGTFAWLQVEDEGCGMSPETLARLFEPGFTTKPDGNGYGLCIAKSVVRGHGGAIDVRTAPGKGTTLRVLLPVVAVAAGDGEATEARRRPRGRRVPGRKARPVPTRERRKRR